jgi:hypothetical protein
MAEGPPTPPHPKAVAGHVKGMFSGHPKWVWALGISVAVGVAYLAWRRSQNATVATDATGATDGSYTDSVGTGVGDSGSGYAYGDVPNYTDGAYGSTVPSAPATADPMGYDYYAPDPGLSAPAPVPMAPDPQGTVSPTGGGPPAAAAVKKPVAPALGPNIFYNADRKLRYIVQKKSGKDYRYYESVLNKGDWGKGGVIPITSAAPAAPAAPHPAPSPTGGGMPTAGPTPAGPGRPQPIMGPNIFFNATRNLRYIVQKKSGKSYRYYESALNRGDWGQGGVIPI